MSPPVDQSIDNKEKYQEISWKVLRNITLEKD